MGIFIAGLIAYLVPDGFVENHLGGGIMPLLIMLLVGMPVFVCATSSTPVVAALALKGLSPGAALVFLLAGPVTNAATIAVLIKILGKKVTSIYVATIAIISIALGLGVNYLYAALSIGITGWIKGGFEDSHGIFAMIMSLVLVGLILVSLFRLKNHKHHNHAHDGAM